VRLEGERAALSQQLAAERSRLWLLGGHVEERSHDNVPLQEETIVRLEGERVALSHKLAARRSFLGLLRDQVWKENDMMLTLYRRRR
jgi:hypothetical protein